MMIARFQLGLRWSARVAALLLVCLLLVFFFGEGPPNLLRQPLGVEVEFVAMFLMIAGFVIGWWRELTGGVLAVGGFALFNAVELSAHGRLASGAVPLFIIPGVLYLASYGASRLAKCAPNP